MAARRTSATPAKAGVKPASKSPVKAVRKPAAPARKARAAPAATTPPAVPPAAAPRAAAPREAIAPAAATPAPAKDSRANEAPEARPKQKLVRDSFTIPKNEYAALAELKHRSLGLGHPVKKSELLRAGIAALYALPDAALLSALQAVPSLKTGRPKDGAKR